MRAALDRWAPWFAAVVALAVFGSWVASVVVAGPEPAAPKPGPAVPLDPRARAVAEEFVATAVARRELDRAWRISAPSLRGTLTPAQWRTGAIPVLPYPVARADASYLAKASLPGDALLEVAFTPRDGASARPARFLLGLRRLGGRWLVSSWSAVSPAAPAPRGRIPLRSRS